MAKPLITDNAKELALRLVEARKDLRLIDALPDHLVPPDLATAYAVDEQVADLLGWSPLGWKIAATTQKMQTKLGSPGPIRGRSYRRFAHESSATLHISDLLNPIVECEFFVTLGANLPPRDAEWSLAEIVDAVANVQAGIEIAECRFREDALPGLTGLVADGSATGQYSFGGPISDWRAGLSGTEVILYVDGVKKQRGTGAEVLGDPMNAVLWLANELRLRGQGLVAGEVISTGSVTGLYWAKAGSTFHVTFGGKACAEVQFI